MKKTIFTILTCLTISWSSYAQFTKGNFLLSGETGMNLSALTQKFKDDGNSTKLGNSTSFSFSPSGGYFIIDNLAAGLSIDLSTSKTKADDTDFEQVSSSVTVGPFVRYYIMKGLFGELSLAVGSSKFKETFGGNTDEDKNSLFGWSLGAGYAVMISDKVAFEPSIGYGSLAAKPDEGSGKSVTSGLLLNVGVAVYLSK